MTAVLWALAIANTAAIAGIAWVLFAVVDVLNEARPLPEPHEQDPHHRTTHHPRRRQR
jgi:hypothetical protein